MFKMLGLKIAVNLNLRTWFIPCALSNGCVSSLSKSMTVLMKNHENSGKKKISKVKLPLVKDTFYKHFLF